jgi:antitoxin MazE
MEIELVRIGNSRGIRIPKGLIEECGLAGKVELTIEEGRIVISRPRHPRQGWKEAFARAGNSTKDELLLPEGLSQFDREEWTW